MKNELFESFADKLISRTKSYESLNELAKIKTKEKIIEHFKNIYEKFSSSVPLLTHRLKLENISSLQERVRLREEFINNNTDVEHWDYAEYIPWEKGDSEGPFHYLLISTLGNVKFINSKGYVTENNSLDKNDYTRILFRDDNWNEKKYFIHRLMCSTFRSIPERLSKENINLLEVNHKDGKKQNSTFENIEWMTKQENINHSIENGLTKTGFNKESNKIYLGTVITDNKYKGMQIVVCGTSEMTRYGLDNNSIYLSVRNKNNYYVGCKWTIISTDVHKSLSNFNDSELMERLVNDKSYMNVRTKPLICTISTGPFKGNKYSFYGIKELVSHGFDQGHVSRACNPKFKTHTHKGCHWEYNSFFEADKYPRGIPEKVLSTIM